jgi:hypothetical protein
MGFDGSVLGLRLEAIISAMDLLEVEDRLGTLKKL